MNVRDLHHQLTKLILAGGHGDAPVIDEHGREITAVYPPEPELAGEGVPEDQLRAVQLGTGSLPDTEPDERPERKPA